MIKLTRKRIYSKGIEASCKLDFYIESGIQLGDVPGTESDQMGVVGGRRNGHRTGASNIGVAQLVGEAL